MKAREFVFILIAIVSIVIALVSLQNKNQVNLRLQQENDPSALYDAQEAYAQIDQLTQQLQQSIAKLDGILEQYATENERLTMENQALQDYIDGFWRLMEQEYDFEGHQERYMERVK